MNNPSKTVVKYIPSCPTITAKLSISITFAATRKNIPIGEIL
jgi:hypothetical protein